MKNKKFVLDLTQTEIFCHRWNNVLNSHYLSMINPLTAELSAQCTLQNTQDLNGCLLLCIILGMTSVDIQFFSLSHCTLSFVTKG